MGQIKFSFLLFYCKTWQGSEAHEQPGMGGVSSALSVLVLKAEPTPELTPELSYNGPGTRQRCHPLSSHSMVQTTAGSLCRAVVPQPAGWLRLASALHWRGGIASSA